MRTVSLGVAVLLSSNFAMAQYGGLQIQIGNGGYGAYPNARFGSPYYGNYNNGYLNQRYSSSRYGYGNTGYLNGGYYSANPYSSGYSYRNGSYYGSRGVNAYPMRRYRRW